MGKANLTVELSRYNDEITALQDNPSIATKYIPSALRLHVVLERYTHGRTLESIARDIDRTRETVRRQAAKGLREIRKGLLND